MDTAAKNGTVWITILLVIALIAAMLLLAVALPSMPHMIREFRGETAETIPEETEPSETHPTATTEEPTEESTEETIPEETEPTMPPPEANPYGVNDFQYDDDNFLTCLAGDYRIGIDVSRYQFDVDWQQVAGAGVEFAMIRVGYRGYGSGALAEDPYAKANLQGAAAAGLDVGVYFFSQAISVEEAEEEARYVLEYIADYEITMPVVFDWEIPNVENSRSLEVDPRTLTDCALAFCRIVEEAGYEPMVYFNSVQARKDLYIAELTDYPFWLALYTPRMRFPYKVQMWQYTDSGVIPGIDALVDLNIWLEYPEETDTAPATKRIHTP